MKRRSRLQRIVLLGFVISVAAVLFAGRAPDKTLIVNGKATDSAVLQIDGRSYVDVEALAQITDGTVTVEPTRVVLTIPVSTPAAAPPPAPEGLSKDFASVAIAALAEMREWRGAIGTILTYGTPVVGAWPQDYRNRADEVLMQALVAASTAEDKDAEKLLENEFANLAQWASDVVATRQSLNATNTVNPNVMQNDPVLAKISDCNRFMSAMLVSGKFSDSPSCH